MIPGLTFLWPICGSSTVRFWPKADLNFSRIWGARTTAFGKSGLSEGLGFRITAERPFFL
jgi:hypothetical protein